MKIGFVSGKPTKVELARDSDSRFAEWPSGALAKYYTETSTGLEFVLCLSCMTPGTHTLGEGGRASPCGALGMFPLLFMTVSLMWFRRRTV